MVGRGREGTETALLTSAICRAYTGNACVPGTMQVAHPREGTDQQVGGGGGSVPRDHSLQRTALTVPRELCNSELSQNVLNKKICPWRLL